MIVLKSIFVTVGVLGILTTLMFTTLLLPIVIAAVIVVSLITTMLRQWKRFVAWYERWYCDQLWQERHRVEEEARRLGALKLPEWPAG